MANNTTKVLAVGGALAGVALAGSALWWLSIRRALVPNLIFDLDFAKADLEKRTIPDVSGLGHHATIEGQPQLDDDGYLVFGGEGTQDRGVIEHHPDFIMVNEVTLVAWVKPLGYRGESDFNTIVEKWHDVYELAFWKGDSFEFLVNAVPGRGAYEDEKPIYQFSPSMIHLGQSYKLAGVYKWDPDSQEGSLYLYVDDELVASREGLPFDFGRPQHFAASALRNYPSPITIAEGGDSRNGHMGLREIQLWNRALSAEELAVL